MSTLSQSANNNPVTIALADDDDDDRELFQEALIEASPHVILQCFNSGLSLMHAITNSNANLPGLIFLDLNMPGKNGRECLKEIRLNESLQSIPIIIFSTSFHKKDIDLAYESGANLYFPKPLSFSQQVEMLKKILAINWEEHQPKSGTEKFVLQT